MAGDRARVYGDEYVEVCCHLDEQDEFNKPFYRIRVGELEVTYDVMCQAYYITLPTSGGGARPFAVDGPEISRESAMVIIDWDETETRMKGIEVLGGRPGVRMLVREVGKPEEERARGHLRVIRPSDGSLVNLADSLAEKWHGGQMGKDGLPYIEHPRAVARIVASEQGRELARRWNVDLEEAQVVALLHDVLEDTPVTADQMAEAGLPREVIDVLQVMTKPEGADYMGHIRRVKLNPTARLVKWADLQHNQDRSRLPETTPEDEARFAKYATAERLLLED